MRFAPLLLFYRLCFLALLTGFITHSQTQELQHISVLGSTLYLPVWRNSSVALVSRYGHDHSAATLALDARPTAALAFHRQRQPPVEHPCARANGGCQHICVTSYSRGAAHAHCLCRHGWRAAGRACQRVRLDSYVLLARGAPPLVQALALSHAGWEAAAPATDAARPTAADVDVPGGYLYYCDVHRCVRPACSCRVVCRVLAPDARLLQVRDRAPETGRQRARGVRRPRRRQLRGHRRGLDG